MYCKFFGFCRRPFDDRPDPQFFFSTPDGEEALAALCYEAQYGNGGVLLLGEAGTGKTQLLRTFLQRVDRSAAVVFLTCPTGGHMDVIRETASGLGISLPYAGTEDRCLVRLRRQLARTAASHPPVLIVDQGENLSVKSMSQVAALTELEHGGKPLIRLVLAGQRPLHDNLRHARFARLSQRLGTAHQVKALTRPETQAYVAHRLRVARAPNPGLFDDEAIERICARSKGIPRLIMHLCDACLLAAYAAQSRAIGREIAEDVTLNARSQEWSVPARDVGLTSAAHVAVGLPGTIVKTAGSTNSVSDPVNARSATPVALYVGERRGAVCLPRQGGSGQSEPRREGRHGDEEPGRRQNVPSSTDGLEGPMPSRGTPAVHDNRLLYRLKAVVARARRIEGTVGASLRRVSAAERQLATLTTAAERLVADLAAAVQRSDGSNADFADRLNEILGDAERRVQGLEDRVGEAMRQSGEATRCVAGIHQASKQADSLETRLRSLTGNLTTQGEQTQKRIGLLVKAARSARSIHGKLAQATRRAAAVHEQNERCATILRGELDAALELAGQVQSRIVEETLRAADEKISQRVRQWEQSADEKVAALQAIIKRSTEAAETPRAAGDNLLVRMQQTLRAMERKQEEHATQLDQLTSAAQHVQEEAQTLISHVDERTERLASHHATAADVIQRLSQLAADGSTLIDSLQGQNRLAQQSLDGLRNQVTEMDQRAATVLSEAESRTGRLAAESESAKKLAECLHNATPDVRRCVTRGEELRDELEQLGNSLEQRCAHAERIGEQMATLAPLTRLAAEQERSLGRLNEEARSVHVELAEAVGVGKEQGTALRELCEGVQGLIGVLGHTRAEMERVSGQVAGQIAATTDCVGAGETLLREFREQCTAIEERLGRLQRDANRIEQAFEAATERPAEILASAHQHAAQLAEICAAVRKVFAAVSKATLDARSSSAACAQASQQATQRMSHLRAQTDRTAVILHEWIEEAACAQARLERTLQVCPSIRETHPPLGRPTNSPGSGGEASDDRPAGGTDRGVVRDHACA